VYTIKVRWNTGTAYYKYTENITAKILFESVKIIKKLPHFCMDHGVV